MAEDVKVFVSLVYKDRIHLESSNGQLWKLWIDNLGIFHVDPV